MRTKIKVLDLFSGIGGFSLGLEATGEFETVAFAESDPFCRKVLKKHWPDIQIWDDVKQVTTKNWPLIDQDVDLICGGFPCQDISYAGKGAGLKGERSGLWKEFYRIIGEVGPEWVVIENVPALRSRGLVSILQDLSKIGYDAEWHCITASHIGAPHKRDRIWIVGYPCGKFKHSLFDGSCPERSLPPAPQRSLYISDDGRDAGQGFWSVEPDVGRVVDGVPNRVDRLRAVGNAVVPQIPYLIGKAITNHATQEDQK